MNPIKAIDKAYVQAGLSEPGKEPERGVFRISQMGYQPRRTMMLFRRVDFPPDQVDGRGMRTFEVGDQRHDALRQKLVDAGFAGRIPVTKDAEWAVEIELPGTGWIIRGHPDGILDSVEVKGILYERVLLEIKTVGSKGWRDATQGIVEDGYLDQAMLYCRAEGLRWIYFLIERKDTQQLCEIMVPYDPERAEAAMRRAVSSATYLNAGVSPLEVDRCSGEFYGYSQDKKTGVMKLGWKCSYCKFTKYCFPTHVRHLVSGKPVCVEEIAVPADAAVIGMGVDVIPRETWKMLQETEDD